MIEIKDKSRCCGCTACVNICPKNCIKMVQDDEGFLYPHIDKDICTGCGFCEKVCPVLNSEVKSGYETKAYIAQNKNKHSLEKSTSGGFFSVLGELIIKKSGYVIGATFDSDFRIKHMIADDLEGVSKTRGSKYAQSCLGDVFSNTRILLDKGRQVCFSGTPCQVAGLKLFLKKDYENLITVDLVCRSVPSPKFWERYKAYQEQMHGSKIIHVNFRNKTYGYHNSIMLLKFKNGKTYKGSNHIDLYGKSFHADICSRPSCYNCKFKTIKRVSDFTICDCWYPQHLAEGLNDNNLGYTNVFVHSEKANAMLLSLQDRIAIHEVDLKKALDFTGGMAVRSVKRPPARDSFYKLLNERSIKEACFSGITISKRDYIREAIKPILFRLGIFGLLYKLRIRNE